MSSNRSTPGASSRWAATTNQGEISDLIFKLQALLPERNPRHSTRVTSTAATMKEVCNYIRKLHEEVDDLSDKLSELLASVDDNNTVIDPDALRTLLALQHN